MKRLIVNADDFGMSRSVNQGIIEAHQLGIVTSTTLLANGRRFDEAVELAQANPRLQIGVHLNAIEGTPLLPAGEVPSLLDDGGRFFGQSWRFGLRHLLGRVSAIELQAEFTAQIARVIAAGIKPTHVDSHQHLHCIPTVFRAAVGAARHFGIDRLRVPTETRLSGISAGTLDRRNRAKSRVITRLANTSLPLPTGIRTTTHFVGPRFMGQLNTDNLVRLIEVLPPGTTELMCHPAWSSDGSRILRDEELGALTSSRVRDAIGATSVTLVGFASIDRCR